MLTQLPAINTVAPEAIIISTTGGNNLITGQFLDILPPRFYFLIKFTTAWPAHLLLKRWSIRSAGLFFDVGIMCLLF